MVIILKNGHFQGQETNSLFSFSECHILLIILFSQIQHLNLTRVSIKKWINELDPGTKSEYLHIIEFAVILKFVLCHITNSWQVDLVLWLLLRIVSVP